MDISFNAKEILSVHYSEVQTNHYHWIKATETVYDTDRSKFMNKFFGKKILVCGKPAHWQSSTCMSTYGDKGLLQIGYKLVGDVDGERTAYSKAHVTIKFKSNHAAALHRKFDENAQAEAFLKKIKKEGTGHFIRYTTSNLNPF